jgi:hypothetical protein
MKKKIIAVVITMLFVVSAFATDWLGTKPNSITGGCFWQFILRLELKDSQKAQIKVLFSKQQEEGAKIVKTPSLSEQDKASRIETLNRITHDKVLSTLTISQRDQLRGMPGFQP